MCVRSNPQSRYKLRTKTMKGRVDTLGLFEEVEGLGGRLVDILPVQLRVEYSSGPLNLIHSVLSGDGTYVCRGSRRI